MNAKKKVVILGDMYELEEETEKEHLRIGELLSKKKIDDVYFCGALMGMARQTYPQGKSFSSKAELIEFLKINPINEAVILVKASRGMALEGVVEVL